MDRAATTHVSGSKLARSGWWLAGMRARRFVGAIDDFTDALRHVPQGEISRSSVEQRDRLGLLIDGIIDDVERFIASPAGSAVKDMERNRHLVKKIYELRQTYESIARGVTADPHMVDVRWKEKITTQANQPQEARSSKPEA